MIADSGWRMADGLLHGRPLRDPIRHPPSAIRHGFTIVELLIALTCTALIGAAIASMMTAVGYGTTSSRELRELAVKSKALCARVTAAVRQSSMVLEAGDDYLVLWRYDTDGDGTPSAAELQRLDYNADADTLTSFEPDPSAADDEYALTDDFEIVTNALIASDELVASLWASDVTDWELVLDNATAQEARLLGLRQTLSAGDLSDVAIAAVSLRN
ncbi:MAG: hypothetical protein IT445_02575 [Phycisphaeraceae bacterium]|nr:hypothetical protein [Phycisphaeraceae bacterium]